MAVITIALVGFLAGCSTAGTKSADVSAEVRKSLDDAGLKTVSSEQDRDKGVVTLGGHVATESDKGQAEFLARQVAGNQVVANEIAVVPADDKNDAKQVNTALDEGIGHNLDAALIGAKLSDGVKYEVKNHSVTLTGEVDSQRTRRQAQKLAEGVPNVEQVVNELQIKKQKASSSN